MPVDVRGYTEATASTGSLGKVVSGQVSDSYISGGVGLVRTAGHIIVQGFVSPRPGLPVTIRSTMPAGNIYELPRFLRVLSSAIIPQDRTTRLELGCRLKYFEDKAESLVYSQGQGLVPPDQVIPTDEPFTGRILAQTIIAICGSKLGLNVAGSVSMQFADQTFDLSAGYVSVLDQLIASDGKIGYLSTDSTITVVNAEAWGGTTARSLSDDKIISVSPIGVGQLPADSVSVTYRSFKVTPDDGEEKEPDDWQDEIDGIGSSTDRSFTNSATSSLSTIVVPYQDPQTQTQVTATYQVRDTTEEFSRYEEKDGNRVIVFRQQQERKSSVAVAGAVVTDYLSAGVPWGSGTVESTTTETFSYTRKGREKRRELVRKADRLYGLGSLGLPMSFPSQDPNSETGIDLVPLPTGTMELERIVVNTYRSGPYQKTVTRRYGPWIQTPMGQQTIAESREYFDTAQKVVDFYNVALDGSFLLDVTVATQRAGDSSEAVISSANLNAEAITPDEADGEDGFRVESVVSTAYAVGTGSDTFTVYNYSAPDTTGMTAAEIAAMAGSVADGLAPAREITLQIPYSSDDAIVKFGTSPVTYKVFKGAGESQARRYGRIYNNLLIGVRYGLSVQVAPQSLPVAPFSPVAITIAGTSGLFRSNATSWTIGTDGMIGSMDALFIGGIGGPSYSFPIAQGVTAPTSLPVETDLSPDQVIGTVADVGGTPQTTLNTAFPGAVSGDGAQDLNTLDYWVYDGATWVNTGNDPAPSVTVTPLPVVTERVSVSLRSRHLINVKEFDYALTLPTVAIDLTTRHLLTARPAVISYVPSVAVALTAYVPFLGARAFVPPATIAVAGVAPWVVVPTQVPTAAITLQANAPVVGELWTPAAITTELWLDAGDTSTITHTSNSVTQWDDKSGNARHVTQGTASYQPTTNVTTQQGLNVIDFASDFLQSGAAASTWDFLHTSTGSSVFMVVKAGNSSDPNTIMTVLANNLAATSRRGYAFMYDDRASASRNDAIYSQISNGAPGAPVFYVSQNQWTPNAFQSIGVVSDPSNGTAANRQLVRFNGNTALTPNANADSVSATSAVDPLLIGAAATNGGFGLQGSIAEIIIVSGLIGTTDREKMEGYLAHRWGLTGSLPGGHPYVSSPPTV